MVFLKKLFGTAQGRLVGKHRKIVRKINAEEKKLHDLSDEEFKAKTAEFKERFTSGESLDSLLVEAYAVVKNACRRLIGVDIHVSGYDQKWDMIPYDVQLIGAIAMHHGSIAEMQTGEGKTLTAALPLYLNALSGKPVHLVTVNDYLAKRDCEWIGTVFRFLGLSVEALINETPGNLRRQVYEADIVYGTSSEFGFDYLRDNSMAQSSQEQCQRGYFFAIVDEIDSILIDEARTPLIISGPSAESNQMYDLLQKPVASVVKIQRDLCNRLATESKKTLTHLGLTSEEGERPKLSKDQGVKAKEALQNLWLVAKGTPQNKTLRRIKEHPDLRAELDKLDTYFYAEPNKEERIHLLTTLYLTVDEKASEYELTDQGIQYWLDTQKESSEDDFTMLDLGGEYAKIDEDGSLDDQEKMQQKLAASEEDTKRKERSHNLRQMLRAHLLMEKDVDYIISNNKIVIIDENTGRPQPGRRFSDGLHQAIEAKEGVAIQGETQTYATITLQNYFRLYDKLAGMTGTAMTEAGEFKEIYKLEVLAIPTNRKCHRTDADDEIYMTEREKYSAVIKDIQTIHSKERPILIGTESVEISEKLSRILRQNKLPHTVLNAKNHAEEAEVIARAGAPSAITVATNMAGRGTDIKLFDGIAKKGGLHVIGTTRHQSRRIDRQLRGRSARQGDPGSSKFYVSFEDTLMRLFTSPRITLFLKKFRPPEGEPISAKILNKSIETAQKRVEQRNYTMRKHTLEYDDVMNKQREEIYSFRNEVLHTKESLLLAKEILEDVCFEMAQTFLPAGVSSQDWNLDGYRNWLMTHMPVTFEEDEFDPSLNAAQIEQLASTRVLESFANKLQFQKDLISETQNLNPDEILHEVLRNLLVRNVDTNWQEHLLHIDHLRTEVSVRSIGQKDPLVEFKHEAFALFRQLSIQIKQEIAHALFKFEVTFQAHEPPATQNQTLQLPRAKKKKERKKPRKKHSSPMIDLSLLDEPSMDGPKV